MTTTFDIDIIGTDGDYSLNSATEMPMKDGFVEQVKDLEHILGETKQIIITFKEDKK